MADLSGNPVVLGQALAACGAEGKWDEGRALVAKALRACGHGRLSDRAAATVRLACERYPKLRPSAEMIIACVVAGIFDQRLGDAGQILSELICPPETIGRVPADDQCALSEARHFGRNA